MTGCLLDTSVLIDWGDPAVVAAVPDDIAMSAISAAELAAGPALAGDPAEAARRHAHVQLLSSLFAPLPFDAAAARSYGLVVAATTTAGRSPRGRLADLLIAATAHARGLELWTRNVSDVDHLRGVVTVVGV